MTFHRAVAVFSASALLGLLGLAQASNFAPPTSRTPKIVFEKGLREKVQRTPTNGCGG